MIQALSNIQFNEMVLCLITAAVFILLLAVMHLLNPDFKPSTYAVSQYAGGRHGWVMQAAFYSFAGSCLLAGIALWKIINHAGAALLFTSAIGTMGVSYFITDPRGTKLPTRSSRLHLISSFLVVPVFPFATWLVSQQLSPMTNWLRIATLAVWVCFALFALVAILDSIRSLAGRLWLGTFQRLMIVSYAIWLIVLASVFL